MFFLIFREDKNVIKVSYYKFVKEGAENIINLFLEGCRYVSKSKGYNLVLKQSILSLERSFLFFTFFNLNLIVSFLNVKLRKDFYVIKSSLHF